MKASAPLRVLLILAAAAAVAGEIIDRIAVSVGNRVITSSDIERDIRVTAFLNGDKPDFSPARRHASADRLIEQTLIRQELETSFYTMPDPKEIEPVLAKFKDGHFASEEAYAAALQQYGLTDQDVRKALLWQRALLLFVAERFRPAVQVDEKEIAEYFAKEVAPKVRAAQPGKEPALDDYRAEIEEAIAGQRVDEEMNKWLADVKRRTRILIHPEAFK